MGMYSSPTAAVRGALPLVVFVAPPPATFGPIFHPPSQPGDLAAVSGGAGAGLVAFTAGATEFRCNG